MREEKLSSMCIANLEIQTQRTILAFPSSDSERYLVILASRKGIWDLLKLNLLERS